MTPNIISHRKEFLAGLAGMGGGPTGLALGGAVAKKTYLDDIFSTYLYNGDGSTSNAIDNGVDLTKGGLVWLKSRTDTMDHYLFDTARGATKYLNSATNANAATSGQSLKSFNNNGFTLGDNGAVNSPSRDMTSWSFRKAPGFCDVVTFTSTGAANQRIPHNLKCEPGMIICKSLTGTSYWVVYHRAIATLNPSDPWSKSLLLDEAYAASTYASDTWGTGPTSTDFGFKAGGFAASGTDWVAYVFAGGESTAATATSCNFLGTSAGGNYDNNKIFCGTTNGTKTADLVYGTGDFTWEAWVKCESSSNIYRRVFHHGQEWTNGTALGLNWDHNSNQNQFSLWSYNLSTSSAIVHSQTHNFDDDGQWHHVAVSRQSGTFRIFVDGILEGTNSSYSGSTENVSTNYLTIGATHNANVQECFKGNISNVRIVKGTAVYTSSFRRPTEPLTNITNTKLLCCNGSSVTSATVTPITLTVGDSSVTASTESPFDDPAAHIFGESGSESVIKCGSYVGSSSADFEVNLGWEPQFIMFKRTDGSANWSMFDSMRGIVTEGNENYLYPNLSNAEYIAERISLTATGFIVDASAGVLINNPNSDYVYLAIRRPDGDTSKPAKAGTDVFAMDAGAGSSTIPNYVSNFPVDFAFENYLSGSQSWFTSARLMAEKYIETNTTTGESSTNAYVFDSNVGWFANSGSGSSYQSWMWKRGASFDVVCWKGQNVQPGVIPHSLGKIPEMMWLRNRSGGDWEVYHKGLNGGSSPETWSIKLNESDLEINTSRWYSTLPTSTHFTVTKNNFNVSNENYIAMLFASVDGISKVGYFPGSNSAQTITTGFQPRFLIIRKTDQSSSWWVLDTTRGWSSGNDNYLGLNNNGADNNNFDFADVTSNGFTVSANNYETNRNGQNLIYYAHA